MSKTLIVSFLPREGSNTAKLVDTFRETIGDGTELVHRSLDEDSIPLINKLAMKTWWGPATQNEVEAASAEFIDEVKNADNVIIATPMYNWTLPAPMKAWFDLVIRGGQTFEFGAEGPKGLLNNQKIGLFVTTGMTELEGDMDHLTPIVKSAFGLMGAGEVTLVGASELMIIPEEEAGARMETALNEAKSLAESWKS